MKPRVNINSRIFLVLFYSDYTIKIPICKIKCEKKENSKHGEGLDLKILAIR